MSLLSFILAINMLVWTFVLRLAFRRYAAWRQWRLSEYGVWIGFVGAGLFAVFGLVELARAVI